MAGFAGRCLFCDILRHDSLFLSPFSLLNLSIDSCLPLRRTPDAVNHNQNYYVGVIGPDR